MAVQSAKCPGCGAHLNFPAGMVTLRCPSCRTVWNPNAPHEAQRPAGNSTAKRSGPAQSAKGHASGSRSLLIGGIVAALVIALVAGAAVVMLLPTNTAEAPTTTSEAPPDTGAVAATPQADPAPAEYREVKLPEQKRREIYDQYRVAARKTSEQPLMIPEGGFARQSMENMLDKVLQDEFRKLAALHDITVDDIQQIVLEGDAKGWDPTPRSNARRNGQPVNP